MLPALTVDGMVALDIFEGSVTKERFISFLENQIVCPCLFLTYKRKIDFRCYHRHRSSIRTLARAVLLYWITVQYIMTKRFDALLRVNVVRVFVLLLTRIGY